MVHRKVMQDPLLFGTQGSIYQYSWLPAEQSDIPSENFDENTTLIGFSGAQFSRIDPLEFEGSS